MTASRMEHGSKEFGNQLSEDEVKEGKSNSPSTDSGFTEQRGLKHCISCNVIESLQYISRADCIGRNNLYELLQITSA